MMTIGIISLTFYLLIIIGHWVIKYASKNLRASFVILLCSFGLVTLTHSVLADHTSFQFFENARDVFAKENKEIHSCDTFTVRNPNINTVILRLDDVHDHYKSDVVEQIVNDTLQRDMTLVAGVIPANLHDDKKMIDHLQKNLCSIEIAQHGLDHSETEFKDLSYEDATEKILKGKKMIIDLFDIVPVTFVPPYNVYSTATGQALHDNDFTHISSFGAWRFDHATKTANWQGDLTPLSEITEACKKEFSDSEPCVIMVHPQDFATDNKIDKAKYQHYTDLLNYIEDNDIQTSTIREY